MMNTGSSSHKILRVENLTKRYPIVQGSVIRKQTGINYSLDEVSFAITAGESLGIIGDAGCGKTTLAKTITQMEQPTSGHVYFNEIDLVSIKDDELRKVRQNISAIIQETESNISNQVIEKLLVDTVNKGNLPTGMRSSVSVDELLLKVGLSGEFLKWHVNECSPGQRQCLEIAKSIAKTPSLIILDEAVSQVDPSALAKIINTLEDQKKQGGVSLLILDTNQYFINNLCDSVAVMYFGMIIEIASTHELFSNPLHPYTQVLLSSLPIADPLSQSKHSRIDIRFETFSSRNLPSGCRFRSRCPLVEERCAQDSPALIEVQTGHFLACHVISNYYTN